MSSSSWDDKTKDTEKEDKKVEKEKPNFGLSGKLTEETNTFKGIVIKYSEPPEARKPQRIRWRLYPFKGQESLPVMHIHRQSAYLLGRERKIADIPIDHPSCSKQHAVIQFRLIPYNRPDGSKGRRIRPYIIDLGSANGTFVNGTQIESSRYVELFEKDILKFGFSSREYVILHEESKGVEDESDGETSSPPPPLKRIKAESTSTSATSATSTSTSTSTQSKVKKEVKVEERREGRHRDRDHRDRDRHGHRDEKAKVKKEKL